MFKFDVSEFQKQRPVIQLAPLVDIAFWALIFFMVIAVYNQMESRVDIKIPKSTTAVATAPGGGKIILNITRAGKFIINGQKMSAGALENKLAKISKLFPNQQVIIRADEMAYHKYIIQAMDACARSNILDVSFTAIKDEDIR